MTSDATTLFAQLASAVLGLVKLIVNFVRDNLIGAFPEEYALFLYIIISLLIAEFFRSRKYVPGAGYPFMMIIAIIIFLLLKFLPK